MADPSPKQKTCEELEKEWWDRWWAEDYSWEGLKRHKIRGSGGFHGEQDLQEYWRRQPSQPESNRDDSAMKAAGELVEGPDRRLWHLAHVPLYWSDGSAAKSAWDGELRSRLKKLISARFHDFKKTNVIGRSVEGPDGRAQLVGGVYGYDCIEELHFDIRAEVQSNCDGSCIFSNAPLDRIFGVDCSFRGVIFYGPISFESKSLDKLCNFTAATFLGDADFSGITFSSNSWFDHAVFCGAALFRVSKFDEAKFSDATFLEEADFFRSQIYGSFRIDGSIFYSRASFVDMTIDGESNFIGCCFFSQFELNLSKLNGFTLFNECHFMSGCDFLDVVANSQFNFCNVVWPQVARDWHGAFRGMRVSARANFFGSGCSSFSAFDGAIFESSVLIDRIDDRLATTVFQNELSGAIEAAEIDESEFHLIDRPQRDVRISELEGGCRVLKQAMASQSDKSREHMFYRFELMARNAQAATPWQERWASQIYGVVSDYGTSITTPLIIMFYLWIFCSLIYVAHGVLFTDLEGAGLQTLWQGFGMSLSRTFMPFSVWSPSSLEGNALGLALIERGNVGLLSLWTQAIGTLQSFFSLVLLFLSGLALRRRFQIN